VSDTTGSLRRQIGGAGDIRSMVRTMKAVAASSIGQYEKSVLALADYYRTVELSLGVCIRESAAKPLRALPKSRATAGVIGAIVFGSDQGLVGQFNDVVTDYAIEKFKTLPVKPDVWAVGGRVHARLKDAGVIPKGLLAVPTSVEGIVPLVGQILLDTEMRPHQAEVAELYLFYNQRTAGAVYAPVTQRLLPLDETWRLRLAKLPWPKKALPEIIGDKTVTFRALIRGYLFVSLFRACAESLESENANRLAAMQRADKNIDDMLTILNRTFHRLRQSGIDEELFDVVSGFEALSTAKGN